MSSRKALSLVVVSAISASCVSARVQPSLAVPGVIAASCQTAIGADRTPSSLPVRWFRPESANDRASLDRWCQAVGPAVVAPVAEQLVAKTRSLTVVSWNAHVGGGDVIGLVNDIRRGNVAGVPASGDLVLLLQEAYRGGDAVPAELVPGAASATGIRETPPGASRVDIVAAARTLGLSLYYAPSMRNGRNDDEDRGNAILSSLPLSDLRAIELPFERQRRVA